jgi:hypothetical protein
MKRYDIINALIQIESENLYSLDEGIKDVLHKRLNNFFELLTEQVGKLQKDCEINKEQWHIYYESYKKEEEKKEKLERAKIALQKSIRKAHGVDMFH